MNPTNAAGLPALIFVNRFFYPDHSATSQLLSDLAFHMARTGRRVQVVASRGLYDDATSILSEREEIAGVTIHRVGHPRFSRRTIIGRAFDYTALYVRFATTLIRIAERNDIVIAKTDPPLLSLVIATVARLKRLRLVNWLQDLYPEVAFGLGMKWLRPIMPVLIAARNASLRSASINVTIGELMASRIHKLGISSSKLATIPNWCDDTTIQPHLYYNNSLRTTWGLEGRFVIGYSGNLGRAHEFKTVIAAAEILRDESDITFLFIGGGYLTSLLKIEVDARHLTHMFIFKPYQDRALLPQSLSLPDIHWISLRPEMEGLIVPSKFYGIAAAGRPTIAITSKSGEIVRSIERFGSGLHVCVGDADSLATEVRALRANPARVAEMGSNARLMLNACFQRSYALAEWSRILNTVF